MFQYLIFFRNLAVIRSTLKNKMGALVEIIHSSDGMKGHKEVKYTLFGAFLLL